jgi:uncharacterized protein YbbC (DUF1343 family)
MLVRSARGFAVAPRVTTAFAQKRNNNNRQASSSLAAKVVKLSDPQTELLDRIDVFIFDCDGVIWRVRMCIYSM